MVVDWNRETSNTVECLCALRVRDDIFLLEEEG